MFSCIVVNDFHSYFFFVFSTNPCIHISHSLSCETPPTRNIVPTFTTLSIFQLREATAVARLTLPKTFPLTGLC